MKMPFSTAKFCETAWGEALETLRFAMRKASWRHASNPFARPVPLAIPGERRTAQVLRIF